MSYEYLQAANETLDAAGFSQKRLEDFDFPLIHDGEHPSGIPYRYAVFGDIDNAKGVVFIDKPHTTMLQDDNIMLRLATQQMALGEDYAVVGIETYNPRDMRLDHAQRKEVSSGNFSSLADRFMVAMYATGLRDDQEAIIYGYSMGADTGTQTVHDNYMNPNRGLFAIAALGAFDPARTGLRSPYRMALDFNASGKDLWESVLAANSPALLEARSIPTDVDHLTKKDKRRHDNAVARGVVGYTLADIAGNYALTRGFSKPDTVSQITDMLLHNSLKLPEIGVLVGIMEDSQVVTPWARRVLGRHQQDNLFEIVKLAKDHSAADDLRLGAAFVLHTVAMAEAA